METNSGDETTAADSPTGTPNVPTSILVRGRSLEIQQWNSESPAEAPIVLVHDGLGSIGQWGPFPRLIAEETGRRVVAYNRAGHGGSAPVPTGPWPANWMATEAVVLGDLLDQLGGSPAVLVGHSDGGTIALLCGLLRPDRVAGVVALAAHTWVEHVCVGEIRAMRDSPGRILLFLANHHANPAALFDAWSRGWTSPGFRSWDIRPELAGLNVPVLIAQGDEDEYATKAMATETAAAIGLNASVTIVDHCDHLMYRRATAEVLRLISDFRAEL